MKKGLLGFAALLLLSAFSAEAQTEKMCSKSSGSGCSKSFKLQQLYASLGTGPAFTLRDGSRTTGGGFNASLTSSCCTGYAFRLGVQHTAFTAENNTELQGALPYLSMYNYNSTFNPNNEVSTVSIALGKRKSLNRLIAVQAFAGLSANITTSTSQPIPEVLEARSTASFRPGALVQAEAMFLPSRFAGLTAGTYFHFVPGFSNGGLSLSLNLGLLKRD